jgi:hypothetical protein
MHALNGKARRIMFIIDSRALDILALTVSGNTAQCAIGAVEP